MGVCVCDICAWDEGLALRLRAASPSSAQAGRQRVFLWRHSRPLPCRGLRVSSRGVRLVRCSRATTRRYACWDAGVQGRNRLLGGTCAWGRGVYLGAGDHLCAQRRVRDATERLEEYMREGPDHRPDREAGTASFPLEMDQPSIMGGTRSLRGSTGVCVVWEELLLLEPKGNSLLESHVGGRQ